MSSMRPPPASTTALSFAWMRPRVSSSKKPLWRPDWLVTTMTRYPAALSLAMAPGTSGKTWSLSGSSQYGTSFAIVSSLSTRTARLPKSSLSTMPATMWQAAR